MNSRHPFKRAERYAGVLRQVVSEILLTKVHHEGLEGVTVTGAEVSDDLQHARVFYRVMNQLKKADTFQSLQRISGQVRRELGRQMKSKYTPEIRFEYDESLDYGNRIEELLKKVHVSDGDTENR